MLPDQSHVRTEDWSLFFLYQRSSRSLLEYHITDEDEKENARKFYVLNLVNTKFDKDVKRGATVKAMCIITPHPFFHVFKPLLLLSLDEYFKNSSIESLQKLYDSINSIDLTRMPYFNQFERQILSCSSQQKMFIEKFQDEPTLENAPAAPIPIEASSSDSIITPNISNNNHSIQLQQHFPLSPMSISSFTASLGINGSSADLSSTPTQERNTEISPTSNDNNPSNSLSRNSSRTTPHSSSSSNNQTSDKSKDGTVATTVSSPPLFPVDWKLKRPSPKNATRDTHFYESKVLFNGLRIPIKVPTDIYPESVGDFSLINLIQTLMNITQPFHILHPELTIYGAYTPPLLVLINGLLTEKKILFVGLNTPSGEVSDRVLAACSLGSGGMLRSFTTNAFPYTDLSKVDDLLSSPAYVAGVKNPAFGHHPSWWDILIDLENNTMKISVEIGVPGPPLSGKSGSVSGGGGSSNSSSNNSSMVGSGGVLMPGGTPTGGGGGSVVVDKDKVAAFYLQTLANMTNPEDIQFIKDLKHMVEDHFAESSVRQRCREYVKRFIRIATNYEEFKYHKTSLWPAMSDPEYNVIPGYGYSWISEAQKANDFNCYASVIEGWRKTRSYKYYIEDQRRIWYKLPKNVVDFDYHLDRLATVRMSVDDAGMVYTMLADNIRDEEDVTRLLATSSIGKLFYLGYGLFHPNAKVRFAVALLLYRIENHIAGCHFFDSMCWIHRITYQRILPQAVQAYQEEREGKSEEHLISTEELEQTMNPAEYAANSEAKEPNNDSSRSRSDQRHSGGNGGTVNSREYGTIMA